MTALDNLAFLRQCVELGVRPIWLLLHGIPGESAAAFDRMAELVPAIEHLPPPDHLYPVRLERFSPYFERAEELGFTDLRPVPAYRAVFPGLSDEQLRDLAYFFDGTPRGAVSEDDLRPLREAVAGWRERFYTAGERPGLTALAMGAGFIAMDSRRTAGRSHRFLGPADWAVLQELRAPDAVGAALARAAGKRGAGEDPARAYARLRDWRFVVEEDGRAVSLLCEGGRRVHEPETYNRFPGGRLRPAAERG